MDNKDNNEPIIEVRDSDFKEIEEELQREGKKNNLTIKSLKVFTYPIERLKRRYHVRYKFNPKHLVFDIAILVTILTVFASLIFYWVGGFHYFQDSFVLKISPQEMNLKSGQVATYVVSYENNNKFVLSLATLAMKFPDNFTLLEVSRTDYNRQDNTLFLGDLASGANGQLIIQGRLFGDIEKTEEIVAHVSYYKTNKWGARLWGLFGDLASYSFRPTGSQVSVALGLPETLISNEEFDLPISIVNNTDVVIDELKLVPGMMKNFQVVTATDNYIDGAWYFYQLKPGDRVVVNSIAKVATTELSTEIKFDAFIKYNGNYLKQFSLNKRQDIFDPHFTTMAVIDRSVVKVGETVKYSVTLRNTNGYNIEDLSLKLTLDGSYFDVASLTPGGQVSGNTVTLDQSRLPALALIMPNETKTLDFFVKIKNSSAGSINPNMTIGNKVSFVVNNLPATVRVNDVNVKVSSDLNVRAFARYYSAEGDQLGRGPLPPVVGQKTKYWVFLQILNDINAVDNLTLTATLPPNVDYENRTLVPVGNAILYDKNTRTIKWSISKVKVDPTNVGVALEVGLTPSAVDLGKYATLLRDIRVSGTDSFTREVLTEQVAEITTNISFDDKGILLGGLVK